MIQPVLTDDQLLASIRAAATEQPSALHLWWLGQSGYLVQWQGEHLLLDPYLSDALTHKYANTAKPHVRLTAIPIAPQRLDFIDVVTSSHNHTDHLDGETLGPLLAVNPALPVLVSAANLDFAAQRLQVPPTRLTPLILDQPVTIGAFTLQAVPAAHEQLEQDAAGHHKFIGLIVKAGPWTIYHSGDTVLYRGMAERLRAWSIDLALLPINGRDPKRGVAGNLSGVEAAYLGKAIRAGLVIPCHYAMFEFNTVDPAEFITQAEALLLPYRVLECGEHLQL
ncbi:MAG: MBL fold metallo-hydrolase [Caldilineaceae bacterium]|nr:MBL fold metallo-hydrolase [Caldilineaceae bacterium]